MIRGVHGPGWRRLEVYMGWVGSGSVLVRGVHDPGWSGWIGMYMVRVGSMVRVGLGSVLVRGVHGSGWVGLEKVRGVHGPGWVHGPS